MGLKEEIPVLSVKHLKKKIKKKWIINDISFDIYEGQIFGFLGPNGSGKTTTIRMLVDLISPTEGSIHVCGKNVQTEHDEALKHVGCIVENPELYTYLTGWENLEHFAAMLPNISQQRIQEVVEIVGMDQRIHDKVKTYSLGMRQRLGIAQALLGKPKLLILDEPTNGLDPQGIKELRIFIRNLAKEGLSLFISSHLLSEIQLMCDRVAIIRKGEVIAVGNVDELLEQSSSTVLWGVSPVEQGKKILQSFQSIELTQLDDFEFETVTSSNIVPTLMNVEDIPLVNEQMVKAGIQVTNIEVRKPSLEDMFLTLTEGERID
ncbi:ABC transporter ATP-binding protein [Chengkuizengella axinellae]|uniref:ABC transporter ATP-binding protein n=1 Tax=Chengkuizengella axinellae TaxID=3064388 RepID=A0ABT9IYL4_9BACL|nr:ABC transporter ATP-binding protein [Chengkuizengella sp. 2205SS18-9]MDP5273900.1 ABC transporter ATP-binding protein [Chengkuizengella sp. 2205SS18-9]